MCGLLGARTIMPCGLRSSSINRTVINKDPSPEEFAKEYRVPFEAVLEAFESVAHIGSSSSESGTKTARLRARGLFTLTNFVSSR